MQKPGQPASVGQGKAAARQLYSALDYLEHSLNGGAEHVPGEAMDLLLRLRALIIRHAAEMDRAVPPATVASPAPSPPAPPARPAAVPAAGPQPRSVAAPQPLRPADRPPPVPGRPVPAASANVHRSGLAQRRHDRLRELLAHMHVLPVCAAAPMRVLELQKSPNASADDFARAVAADAGLSSKILGLANSAWYAPQKQVTRLPTAIVTIGLRNLLPLVFSLSLAGTFNELKLPHQEKDGLWRAALLKAIAARQYAARFCPDSAEEAFTCGLLQDIALPVMYGADPSAWTQLTGVLDVEPSTRAAREQAIFGCDHVEFGVAVAEHLGLPPFHRDAIREHHQPLLETCADAREHMLNATRLAALMPHRLVAQHPINLQTLRTRLGHLTPGGPAAGHMAPILESIPQSYRELLSALGSYDPAAFPQFLQRITTEVARSVEAAISQSHQQVTRLASAHNQLQQRVRDLAAQAAAGESDELTGLLNRRGLLARMDNILAAAREYAQECGLAFLDLDSFKSINDRAGHAAGDAALKTVAEAAREITEGQGLACRLGGDEFVLILHGLTCDQAAERLEQLRRTVAARTVEGNGQTLSLSASIGLHWLGQPPAGLGGEQILQAADQRMYEAKRGGKNRVVVGRADQPPAIPPAQAA